MGKKLRKKQKPKPKEEGLSLWLPPFLRFIMELATWGWLLLTGFYFLAIFSILALAFINFEQDKQTAFPGLLVPGFIRVGVEIISALLGIFAASTYQNGSSAIFQTILVLVTFYMDRERWKWILGFREMPPDYVLAAEKAKGKQDDRVKI